VSFRSLPWQGMAGDFEFLLTYARDLS